MKRIFPIIVILISLSLLGIIVLQVSWFKDMIELRQGQLLSKVEEAGYEVAMELSTQASTGPTLKLPRNQKLSLLPEDYSLGLQRPTLAQHYSFYEINEKLHHKFIEKGITNVQFEFAITSNSNLYSIEMQSQNFLRELEDSLHNKTK